MTDPPPPRLSLDAPAAAAQPTNAVERAVVAKGRPSSSSLPSPLVLIHPPPAAATVPALAFARHATLLHRHLLGRLRATSRYAGVVLVGLEDDPATMLPLPEAGENEEEEGAGGVLLIDGFGADAAARAELDFGSPQAFATSVQRALSSTIEMGEQEEEEEEDDECWALGLDSVNMLAHRLGSADGALRAIQALLQAPAEQKKQHLSPLVTVLHPEGVRGLLASVWEDAAATNIYVHPMEGGRGGRCLVVRRSASGRVQEEWEPYQIVVDPDSGGDMRVVLGGSSAGAAAASALAGGAEQEKGSGTTKARQRKEEAFLESLPFRLSLNDQEQVMRQGVVLPHERRRTATGEALPLGYQQEGGGEGFVGGGYEDDEFDDEEMDYDFDEDEGIDDDLDL